MIGLCVDGALGHPAKKDYPMCGPKAPKEDPEVKRQQALARQREQERIEEEKKKALSGNKAKLRGSGVRSVISGSGTGFGSNY